MNPSIHDVSRQSLTSVDAPWIGQTTPNWLTCLPFNVSRTALCSVRLGTFRYASLPHAAVNWTDYATCHPAGRFSPSRHHSTSGRTYLRKPTGFRPGATAQSSHHQPGRPVYMVQARCRVAADVEMTARWPACLLARLPGVHTPDTPTLYVQCSKQAQSARAAIRPPHWSDPCQDVAALDAQQQPRAQAPRDLKDHSHRISPERRFCLCL